jgi:hypothetical protein
MSGRGRELWWGQEKLDQKIQVWIWRESEWFLSKDLKEIQVGLRKGSQRASGDEAREEGGCVSL